MIGYLKGTVLTKEDRYMILLVGEHTGYRVYTTSQILESVHFDQEIALYIHTYVRDEILDLYGFATPDELRFFEQLIGISGVGPKSATGIMSIAPIADIKKAIIHGDPKLLQKVSSIGKKTAERIIVDLKEKISVTDTEEASGLSITDNIQLMEALQSLGYKEGEIRRAMTELPHEKKELSEKIKEALKILSKTRS